jgi:hypothetical protein
MSKQKVELENKIFLEEQKVNRKNQDFKHQMKNRNKVHSHKP